MRLTLLHFNDLHARLERLPRLASLIQRERAAAQHEGRRVLILDAGDSSDWAVWESDITKGRANFALLEALGVQASVVGNGEALQWGRAALERLIASVHFPVLAANLVDARDPERLAVPNLLPSSVLEIDGFRLGVIGLTARYGTGYTRFGYDAVEPLPPLRREIGRLRAQGVRSLILLSHLGASPPEDRLNGRVPNETNDYDVARTCPEIAVIVGGHSHIQINPPMRQGHAVLAQAGDHGRWLGRLDLELDEASGLVRDFSGGLIACDESVPPDPTLSATLELVREEAGRLLDAPVGRAARDYPHSIDQPSPFGRLVADALRELCRADLALLFSGFMLRGLAAGPVTRRALYQALPGSTHVTAAEVSGAQIWRLLDRMLTSPYRTQSFNPKRSAPPLGLPAASGNVRLAYDLTRPAGEQLLEVEIDGALLDPARRYRLASTYFTLSDITDDPEYDFIGLQPGQVIEQFRVEDVLWEVVADWLRARGTG